MDERIVRVLSGTATEIEQRQVERWRAESEANERTFQDAASLWSLTGRVAPQSEVALPDLAALRDVAEERRRKAGTRALRRRTLTSPWIGYGIAAAAVLAFVVLRAERPSRIPQTSPLSTVGSSAGTGDVTTLNLSDGSTVRLARSSRVEFPAQQGRREVVLEGRAFFAVASGETPFVVRTALGEVSVHGTRFEVRAADGELRVIVIEGVVRIEGGGASVDVRPGQVAHLIRGAVPRVVDADVWSLLDWPSGLLVFQATPLRDVASEVERQFGRKVSVTPAVEDRSVTAWFDDESLDEVVNAVCLVAGVQCSVADTAVVIGR